MRIGLTHLLLWIAGTVLVTGCAPVRHNLPPAERLQHPGPGVGGPGPGVMAPPAMMPQGPMMGGPGGPMMGGPMMGGPMMGAPMMGGPGMPDPSIMESGVPAESVANSPIQQAAFNGIYGQGMSCNGSKGCACCNDGSDGDGGIGDGVMQASFPMNPTVQVTFARPESMHIQYDATGNNMFDSEPLVVPARQNFPAGGLYRLKLTNIVGREGVELYPSLEIAPPSPRTGAYLAHNSIPIQITEEDLDQVLTGNFVTKVIYLPDPDFQGPALAGIDTLVSTRLDPGVDPIVEADRRGSILAILRLGDKDIEMAGAADQSMFAAGAGAYGGGYPGGAMVMGDMSGSCGPGSCGPGGCGAGYGGPAIPGGSAMPPQLPGMIAGITAPQYGMPISGTPIGLPGPPHIPLGGPAGLKKHTMHNHTRSVMPAPVKDIKIGVKLQPGYTYPHPVSRINITEQNIHPGTPYGRPKYTKGSQAVSSPNAPGTVPGGGGMMGSGDAYCPPE